MPRSWLTIALLLSFLVVTAGLRFLQLPAYPREVWIVLGFFAVVALLWELLAQKLHYTIQSNSIIVRGGGFFFLCIILGASLAFFRVSQTTHVEKPDSIESLARGENVTLRGWIVDEPDRRPLKTRYTVDVVELCLGRASSPGHPCHPEYFDKLSINSDEGAAGWPGVYPERSRGAQHDRQEVSGKVLVTDYAAWPRHDYGDEVIVRGELSRPGMNEDFAYDRYLSRFGITALMPRATLETVSVGHGSAFFSFLYASKERFERQINRLYPEPHASFLSGLLTGSRRGIPDHLLEDFQTTGLTHIIAISGYNITIVLSIIGGFLFFLPLRWRFFPSLLAIAFFTLFVGASPSVVRAAIMGALGLLALQTGRQKHALIAILLTAAIMVAWNPKILWYDAGFQLSFLAVLGITYLSPFLEPFIRIFPDSFAIRESLKTTLAAQIAAVPLVTLLFGQFSLVAPLANVAVALLIPFAMLVGFVGVIVSFLSFPLGLSISYLSFGALELIIVIAETLADLPYASLAVSRISMWWVVLYYALLVMGYIFWNFCHAERRPASLTLRLHSPSTRSAQGDRGGPETKHNTHHL